MTARERGIIRDITIGHDPFHDLGPVRPKPPPDVPYLVPRPEVVMEGTCLLDQFVAGQVRKLLVVEARCEGMQPGPLRMVPDCTSSKMPYTVVDVQVKQVEAMRVSDVPEAILPELDRRVHGHNPKTVLAFAQYWLDGTATPETRVLVCDIEFERAYNDRFLEDGDPAINPEYVRAMAEYAEWLKTSPECEDYRKAMAESPFFKMAGENFPG